MKTEQAVCKLCGEPMPKGEEMFYYHGLSGPCPKPPLNEIKINDHQVQAIRDMQATIHHSCLAAGWYNDLETGQRIDRNFGEVIALMHSELSEALEGWRKDLQDDHLPHRKSIEVEFADVIIRILDTAGAMQLDLAGALQEKFAYNQSRQDHKIESRKAAGGKKI